MNIISARQESRKNKINELTDTIRKAFSADVDIDKEKLINECCLNWGMSRRTVLEYLDIALSPLNTEEMKFEGRVLISQIKEVQK